MTTYRIPPAYRWRLTSEAMEGAVELKFEIAEQETDQGQDHTDVFGVALPCTTDSCLKPWQGTRPGRGSAIGEQVGFTG
jgi:hypothetical protein